MKRGHSRIWTNYNVSTIEPPAPAEPLPTSAKEIEARVEERLTVAQAERKLQENDDVADN